METLRRAPDAVRTAASRTWGQRLVFKGKVADLDQSKVWVPGTCLGSTRRTTSPMTSRWTAQHHMPWRSPASSTLPRPTRRLAAGAGTRCLRQRHVQQDDRCLSGSCSASEHHLDADLQHCLAAELGRRQPTGHLQYRGHTRQWRLGNADQQRQGPLLINGQPPVPPPSIPEERLNLPLPPG